MVEVQETFCYINFFVIQRQTYYLSVMSISP